MKEMKFVNLTSRSQKPYSGYGDKIMEGKPDMPPNSQPTNPEVSEAKPISAENKRAADMMALGKDQKLPVGVRRALEDIKRQEVIKNALLGDSERVDVAAKLLKRDLTEKEREALLKAHNQGKGEAGKHNGPAGVYNYTNTQLLKKTRILNEAGFSKEDRRILMEAGLVGVATAGISDPAILNELNRINTLMDPSLGLAPEGALKQGLEKLIGLQNVPDSELKIAIANIQKELKPYYDQAEKKAIAQEQARPDGFWMKLKPEDFIMLRKGEIETWVNKQYDVLYTATQGTRVAESQLLQDAQAAYGEATLYLSKIVQKPEQISELRSFFETRLNIIVMSSTISTKNIEQAQQAAGRLLATGLLHGMSLDSGKVGSMYNRACELLEDMRLKADRGHVTPLMWEELKRDLIAQQLELAGKGIGDFVLSGKERELLGLTDKEKTIAQTEKNITRSVNTALDLMVCSQRLHIIAARGKELFGNKSFFSDAGSAFRVFNLETFHAYKWQQYNTQEVQVNNLVKDSLTQEWMEDKEMILNKGEVLTQDQAKEAKALLGLRGKYKEELGDSLLKEMSTVNDFFNAGWRVEGMLDQLDLYFAHLEAKKAGAITGDAGRGWKDLSEERRDEFKRIGKDRASDFGLFLRLKAPREGLDNRAEAWKKIVQYRPEEVIRLLRDRVSEYDPKLNVLYGVTFQGTGFKNYDQFKERFGSAIRAIREKGMKADDPHQIDFANLAKDSEYWKDLDRATDGNAQVVVDTYKRMQEQIKQNYVKTDVGKTFISFEWDPRFADIYSRTLNVDDAFVGKLEDAQKEFEDMTSLSKIWAADIGGDILVRNMNDIAAGQRAVEEYMKFIAGHTEKEKLEAAEKSAAAYAEPNGSMARAKVLRHTYIAFLEASMLPELIQSLGIKHLPFRLPATEIQKIYGPQMEGFSVEELLNKRDHIRGLLIANADQARKEAEVKIEKISYDMSLTDLERETKIGEQYKKIEKAKADAHKQAVALDRILKVRLTDRVKVKALSIVFGILAFMLAEAVEVTGVKDLANQK